MWKKNQKIIDIVNKKTFQPRLKTRIEKPKMCGKERDLIEEKLSQNKLLFSSQWGQTASGQTATAGFLRLSTLVK